VNQNCSRTAVFKKAGEVQTSLRTC